MSDQGHLTDVIQRDNLVQIVPLDGRRLSLYGTGLSLRGFGLPLCGIVRRLTGRELPGPDNAMSLRK
ncbi:MAG: hypothetical protein ABJ327_26000 [Litoreibacter sp.]